MVHENQIRNSLLELRCSVETLAMVSGISNTRISRAFRGFSDFSGQEAELLLSIVQDFRALVQDAAPYPVSFKEHACIKSLIQKRHEGCRYIVTAIQEIIPGLRSK